MPSLIEVQALTKTYAIGELEIPALRGVDLTIGAGEFVAVMGPSGCGKTTLLNVIGGLDRPTDGRVLLDGRRVEGLGQAEWSRLRRTTFAFVFQAYNLLGDLTALENVALPQLLAGVSRRDAERRAHELLERLGLADLDVLYPHQLSGGQQQRVAAARGLANRPALLLADEPTGSLDSLSARELLAVLDELRRDGQAILLVTHDARVAARADRIVRMRDGLVVDDSTLDPFDAPLALRGITDVGAA